MFVEQNEADRNDIQRVELEGANCLITEQQLASFDICGTETNVIDSRKKLNAIGHFRNVRGLGKSMVAFRLFEKLKYSNERSTTF